MSTIITRGAASAQALGYAASTSAANYIEDVFSTYLYAGNGGTQTITNGVDLSTKGGLVWIKNRDNGQAGHMLTDTVRGAGTGTAKASTNALQTNSTGGTGGGLPTTSNDYLSAFTTTGFTVVSSNGANDATKVTNRTNETYAAWSFREQAKFFDIVTYTGNGANRTISHNLGSIPGCIVVKRTDTTGAWATYHRSLANTQYLIMNTTAAVATGATYWNSTTPTSSVFSLGTATDVNANGGTYVAYLFAHDAGGFGASGSDNVISCGSFTTDGSGDATVNLGYEPQWVLMKASSATSNWFMVDNMRGMAVSNDAINLFSNTSGAETGTGAMNAQPLSTGFKCTSGTASDTTYIYIAIRRGPMKTPTSGTSVFGPVARSGTGANATVSGGQLADAVLIKNRGSAVGDLFAARLTGTGYVVTSATTAEVAAGTTILQANPWDVMDGVKVGTTSTITNASSNTFINYLFRRAPGFFDVVCYTGTGSATTQSHNLGVVPELMIVKYRSGSSNEDWIVYSAATGNSSILFLNTNDAKLTGLNNWNNTTPSSTTFSLGGGGTYGNITGNNYVAYLFATVAGVSKVGSYTGTGTTLQVNCGFTGGARFVLIKRTDSTGDWYVWDSARGIVAGNDPYLLLNSTAAEVTNTDYVDTYSAGFEISSTAPAAINANGGSFIFLAIS